MTSACTKGADAARPEMRGVARPCHHPHQPVGSQRCAMQRLPHRTPPFGLHSKFPPLRVGSTSDAVGEHDDEPRGELRRRACHPGAGHDGRRWRRRTPARRRRLWRVRLAPNAMPCRPASRSNRSTTQRERGYGRDAHAVGGCPRLGTHAYLIGCEGRRETGTGSRCSALAPAGRDARIDYMDGCFRRRGPMKRLLRDARTSATESSLISPGISVRGCRPRSSDMLKRPELSDGQNHGTTTSSL